MAHLGPGKFSTTLTRALYDLTLDVADDEAGDVSTFGVWGALLRDGPALAEEAGGIDAEERLALRHCAGAIVFEDDQGFVEAELYDTAEELNRAWANFVGDWEQFARESDLNDEPAWDHPEPEDDQRANHESTDIRSILALLTVGSGGQSSRKELTPDWTIDFYENTDADSRKETPFKLRLGYRRTGRSSTMGLSMEDVFTKGKSPWRRDNAWRLRPETVERVAQNIEEVLSDPRSSQYAQGDPRRK